MMNRQAIAVAVVMGLMMLGLYLFHPAKDDAKRAALQNEVDSLRLSASNAFKVSEAHARKADSVVAIADAQEAIIRQMVQDRNRQARETHNRRTQRNNEIHDTLLLDSFHAVMQRYRANVQH